jgi:DNA-binding transcriptional regulator of glucitol operon
MCENTSVKAWSFFISFLVSCWMLSVMPVALFAQQDTTDQVSSDSVSQRDSVEVVPSDTAAQSAPDSVVGRDTTAQVPADTAASGDTTGQEIPDSLSQAADSVAAGDEEPVVVTYESDDLEAVARALVAVDEVRKEYRARQGLPEGSVEGENLHARFRDEVIRIIEQHGITVEFYSEIMHAARERPLLRKRLLAAVSEIQEQE